LAFGYPCTGLVPGYAMTQCEDASDEPLLISYAFMPLPLTQTTDHHPRHMQMKGVGSSQWSSHDADMT